MEEVGCSVLENLSSVGLLLSGEGLLVEAACLKGSPRGQVAVPGDPQCPHQLALFSL